MEEDDEEESPEFTEFVIYKVGRRGHCHSEAPLRDEPRPPDLPERRNTLTKDTPVTHAGVF